MEMTPTGWGWLTVVAGSLLLGRICLELGVLALDVKRPAWLKARPTSAIFWTLALLFFLSCFMQWASWYK